MEIQSIILADDHPLVLMAMQNLIGSDFNFKIVAAVSGSSELIKKTSELDPNIIITDYSMPGDLAYGDGIRLVKYLINRFPKTKILVLTMVSNHMIISALYDAGVNGVVSKSGDLREILNALYFLKMGRIYYPPGFQQDGRVAERTKFIGERINSLSPREFEVLRHFVRGESIVQIATRLNRSVKTVSGQKIAAMRKLDVKTDQALIEFCVGNDVFQ